MNSVSEELGEDLRFFGSVKTIRIDEIDKIINTSGGDEHFGVSTVTSPSLAIVADEPRATTLMSIFSEGFIGSDSVIEYISSSDETYSTSDRISPYHTDATHEKSFLYLMDRAHVGFEENNFVRRQWREISVYDSQEHLLEQFLDVKSNIRLLDVCASGSGYCIRWWLYRNLAGQFFLVHSTSAKDHGYGREDVWRFIFYDYTENQIRGIFMNDASYYNDAVEALFDDTLRKKKKFATVTPSDSSDDLSSPPPPLHFYRYSNKHHSISCLSDIDSGCQLEEQPRSGIVTAQSTPPLQSDRSSLVEPDGSDGSVSGSSTNNADNNVDM